MLITTPQLNITRAIQETHFKHPRIFKQNSTIDSINLSYIYKHNSKSFQGLFTKQLLSSSVLLFAGRESTLRADKSTTIASKACVINQVMPTNGSDDEINITRATPNVPKSPIDLETKKIKRSGSFGILKAALSMIRGTGRTKKTKKSNNDLAGNGNWTDMIESVRPLHLSKIDQSPSPSILPELEKMPEDLTPVEASPARSLSCGTSQYASASSLRDLVDSGDEEEDDPDEVFDAITGDEMIDSKAEEFIAQFYKQIRIQNTAVVHHQRQRTI